MTRREVLMASAVATISWGQETKPTPLTLWYDAPASKPGEADSINPWQNSPAWLRALPVGNGRLGGMVYGNVETERILLNEDSLWSGAPQNADNPKALEALPQIRQLLLDRKYAEAQKLTYERLVCKGKGSGGANGKDLPYGSYQMLANLLVTFTGQTGAVEAYRRELNLENAVASVQYTRSGVRYRRECIASRPDEAILVRLTADKPAHIGFTATLTRPERGTVAPVGTDTVVLTGRLANGTGGENLFYEARLKVLAEGGSVTVSDKGVMVSGADAATLIVMALTTYRLTEAEITARLDRRMKLTQRWKYDALKTAHIADYSKLFGRVALNLGESPNLPTDARLARLKAGENDPALFALYFQYGRYLLIASSRPDDLPANLQGIWAEHTQTPWNGDYHHNINDQMNYWHAETTNLSECHLPFLDYIQSLEAPGRRTARVHYDARGWVVHTISNIWGFTSPGEHPSWGQYPCATAWLCQHLYEHYAFTNDKAYLAKVFPTLRSAAEFYLDFLIPDPRTGYLVTAPSNSPENAFKTADGQQASVCMAPTMDMSLLRELFSNTLAAARALKTNKPEDLVLMQKIEAVRRKLVPLTVGKDGRLLEWMEEFDEPEPGHRHMSHLYGLCPGNEIAPRTTPALAAAAEKVLEKRLSQGGGGTGWSRAWVVNFWARLGRDEQAFEHLTALLTRSTAANLFDMHPPFQIDGNFGGTAGIAEMLLQSHTGEIALLPALPQAWATRGSVRGLKARGNIEVGITWESRRATQVTLRAVNGGSFRVRAPFLQRILNASTESGKIVEIIPDLNDDAVVTVIFPRNQTVLLKFA